ncbi:MAG: hypothetical protein ACKVRO_13395 [Micropepsaceae bacterium]
MRFGFGLRAPLAAAAALWAAAPALADGPAVSATNLKVTATGGSITNEGAWAGVAALTAPLSPSWGFQGEAGAFGVDGDSAWGLAGHVFQRDPDNYLAGLFVAYAHEDEFDFAATRVGAEVEFYLDRVTLLLHAGYEFADLIDDSAFGGAELRWYATDNFALGAGVNFDEHSAIGRAHAEWLLGGSALPGLALRVDGTVGDDDFDSIMGGLTYYFGPDASLKDRHRKQDPDSALFTLFQSIEQERARQCAINVCNGPPPPPPPT